MPATLEPPDNNDNNIVGSFDQDIMPTTKYSHFTLNDLLDERNLHKQLDLPLDEIDLELSLRYNK